jgi:hypothetical protein
LTAGVIALDFIHATFQSTDGCNAKEVEVDLIRAFSSVAKQLYDEEGLLSVYVSSA